MKKKQKDIKIFRIIIFLGTILLLLIIIKYRHYLYQFEDFGYIGLFVINAFSSATILLPLPSIATVFIGGSIWNPLSVAIISGIGSSVGELIGFFLGYGGRGIIDHLDGKEIYWLKKFEKWFKKSGFITIFILAAIPEPFFDVVGILAGTLNYPVWKFFLATAMGRTFRNIIIAWLGGKIIPSNL